ncbi:MAG: amidohydrolase [Chloroflexi bacterium]|nr:amidohydrolase [Chloroflexota bacterium]
MENEPKIPINILITHGFLISMDAGLSIIQDGAIAIEGSRIAAIGTTSTLESQYQPQQIIDASGMFVMPGLINTHTHSGDILFRGLVEDLPLESWLEQLWVAENHFINAESVGWGARLAYIEMVRSGITTALDMFWFPYELAQAAKEVGFHLATGFVFFDSPIADGMLPKERYRLARQFLTQYACDELIIPAVQPHSVYTVSTENLKQASKLAQEFGTLFVTHASETLTEVRNCRRDYGCTPIQYLDRLGALTPRTVLAHCVHLDSDEFDLLSQRGVSVANCPVSNMKLASGIANVSQMLLSGVNVTLGTDGPVSGNDLNLWYTMRLAALVQKTVNHDASLMSTKQVVSMATREGAKALGISAKTGSLEVGKQADIILVQTGRAHSTPSFDPYSSIVYSLGREDVETVLINGRLVMYNRNLLTINETEVIEAVRQLGIQIAIYVSQPNQAEKSQTGIRRKE